MAWQYLKNLFANPVEENAFAVFKEHVRRSGLVDTAELDKHAKTISHDSDVQKQITTLATALVDSELLTNWQADSLRARKYKGYFLGEYKLVDFLHSTDYETHYAAKHLTDGILVEIAVTPKRHSRTTERVFRIVGPLTEP